MFDQETIIISLSHENRKNSLLKSLFLFGVFNENKKITLISFINQNLSEKYYQSKVLPLSKVPNFLQIFQISIKKYF